MKIFQGVIVPVYKYKATNVNKKVESGLIMAKNRQEVAEMVEGKGLTPLSIKQDSQIGNLKQSVPQIEKITFVRYLSTMLTSGISLSEGILVLQEETKHKLMKEIISDVSYSLNKGQQLSMVFSKYPKVFNRMFITLTKAGEVSGTLAETFSYLEEELRAEYSLSQKIKGAMLYPAIVFIAMIAIGIMMFFFILPQIGKVFLNMKLPLPKFTKALFAVSIFSSEHIVPILLSMVVSFVILFLFFRSLTGKKILLKLISPLPVVKSIMRLVDLARFTRIFSTLIRSAVPIIEALEISLDSLSWAKFRDLSPIISDQVRKGKSLSEVFKGYKMFPVILTQMISTGEKSGTLDKTLGDLAGFYEEEVGETVGRATQLLEPILMMMVGIGVGAIILSIISPLYSVVGSLQGIK